MVKAIDEAMSYAYFGPEGFEETKALKKKDKPEAEKPIDAIKEALKLGFVIGITPDVFWKLTPWQFKCCIDAYTLKNNNEFD
jgi:hypothetical protein